MKNPISTNQKKTEMTTLRADEQPCFISINEQEMLQQLKVGNSKALDYLFSEYYDLLCQRVSHIIKDREYAEDIVQEIFMNIWKKRETLEIKISLKAYLLRSAMNRSLNYIRDNKVKFQEIEFDLEDSSLSIQLTLEKNDFEARINAYIDMLPPKCKAVFVLNRFDQMKYKEIAEMLNISVKTVENHIAKALAFLRIKVYGNPAIAC